MYLFIPAKSYCNTHANSYFIDMISDTWPNPNGLKFPLCDIDHIVYDIDHSTRKEIKLDAYRQGKNPGRRR
jgi:hypothetical protein